MAGIEVELHSDSEDLRELCRQYWQVTEGGKFAYSVSELADAFKINRSGVQATVAANSTGYSREQSCADCGAPRPFKSRSDYENAKKTARWGSWVCEDCQSDRRADAEQSAQRKAQIRHEQIQKELDAKRRRGLSIEHLSFRDAVFLLSILRVGGAENLTYIAPHDTFQVLLSPTTEFDRAILNELYERSVICIHPGSREESITMEDGQFTSFYPFKVHWILPLPDGGPSPMRFLEQLETVLNSDQWPKEWTDQAAELHRTIALHECLQYLRVSLEEHGFDLKAGDKTHLVLTTALKTFSIGQVYNFIWRAARDAAAFYVREETSRAHAANIVPGSIQRMAERALAERWEVKPYRRDFRAPQSIVSQVLFTVALKLPEGGFNAVPPRVNLS